MVGKRHETSLFMGVIIPVDGVFKDGYLGHSSPSPRRRSVTAVLRGGLSPFNNLLSVTSPPNKSPLVQMTQVHNRCSLGSSNFKTLQAPDNLHGPSHTEIPELLREDLR
jgi:hypothetical protein